MLFVKNVKFCMAESGEYISNFAKKLVDYRAKIQIDIIAKFNNIYIEVNCNMTAEDIINYYHEQISTRK